MELKIINTKTGESYKSKTAWGIRSIKDNDGDFYYNDRDINSFLRYPSAANLSDEHYQIAYARDKKDGSIIDDRSEPVTTQWQDEPATQKQYNYIRTLGYYDFEEYITKGQASQIIDMIKSGEASAINMFCSDEGPTSIF